MEIVYRDYNLALIIYSGKDTDGHHPYLFANDCCSGRFLLPCNFGEYPGLTMLELLLNPAHSRRRPGSNIGNFSVVVVCGSSHSLDNCHFRNMEVMVIIHNECARR